MSMMQVALGAVHTMAHVGSSLAMFQADKIDSGNAKTLETFVVIAAVALAAQAIAICGIVYLVFKLRAEVLSHIGDIKAKAMPLIEKSHGLVDDLSPKVKDITGKVQTLVTDLSPTIKSITAKTDTLIGDLSPTIKNITSKTDTLIGELSPKINGITDKVQGIAAHAEEIAAMAKDKVQEFSPTISEANQTAKDAIGITRETVSKTNEIALATVADVSGKAREQIDRFNGIVSDALDATVKLGKAIEHGVTAPANKVAGIAVGAKATVEHLVKQYGGLFRFGSKKKPAAGTPSPRPNPVPPVTPHSPEAMGSVHAHPFGAGATGVPQKEYMDERDLDL